MVLGDASFGDVLRAFITIFLAELPDKTMVATVVLTARFRRPVVVWLGVAGAFTVHVAVSYTHLTLPTNREV